jgi:hypothetical protein
MIFVDSNIILDVWTRSEWSDWSLGKLRNLSSIDRLIIDPIVYAEVSVSFTLPAKLDMELDLLEVEVQALPRYAAFLAAKAFLLYRRGGGTKSSVLPDFFIGAHAAVLACPLLTRDTRRYVTYFPSVSLIAP